MVKISIEQMRELVNRVDLSKKKDKDVPKSYIDRLERAAQLLAEYRKAPQIDWDHMETIEDIERAEALVEMKDNLTHEIEKHFHTCGLLAPGRHQEAPVKKERQRKPRRDKEQIEYDRKVAEITKAKKAEMGLPPRGRIPQAEQVKLDHAIEKELKAQKIYPPKG